MIQSGFQQNLRDQESKVVTPVVGLNTRMDQMSQDMHTRPAGGRRPDRPDVQDAGPIDRSEQRGESDVQRPRLRLRARGAGRRMAGMPAGGAARGDGAPTISATDLYNNANRDRNGGKLDLALAGVSAIICAGTATPTSRPNAQYYIAWIHASQGDYNNAIREYDAVLEKYPDNNKTADAMYGKGMALDPDGPPHGRRPEFQELIKRFPTTVSPARPARS